MAKPERLKLSSSFVTEFVVIVAGVFAALATETWWSEREQRAFESEVRSDMAAEFRSNVSILSEDIEFNLQAFEANTVLTNLDDEDLQAIPDSSFDSKYGGFVDWNGFDPEMGVVQAMVESGNLTVISDRELRLRLSRWSGLLEEKARRTLQAVNFQLQVVVPIVSTVRADLKWSPMERRQVRNLYQSLGYLQDMVLENQRRLLTEAENNLEYLTASD